jgi:hypothetical protein
MLQNNVKKFLYDRQNAYCAKSKTILADEYWNYKTFYNFLQHWESTQKTKK